MRSGCSADRQRTGHQSLVQAPASRHPAQHPEMKRKARPSCFGMAALLFLSFLWKRFQPSGRGVRFHNKASSDSERCNQILRLLASFPECRLTFRHHALPVPSCHVNLMPCNPEAHGCKTAWRLAEAICAPSVMMPSGLCHNTSERRHHSQQTD